VLGEELHRRLVPELGEVPDPHVRRSRVQVDVAGLVAVPAQDLQPERRAGHGRPDQRGERQPGLGADAVGLHHLAPADVVGDRAVGDDPDAAVATDPGPERLHPTQRPGGHDDDPDALLLHLPQHALGVLPQLAGAVEEGPVEVGRDQLEPGHVAGQ
jgi:hypothetical protein